MPRRAKGVTVATLITRWGPRTSNDKLRDAQPDNHGREGSSGNGAGRA